MARMSIDDKARNDPRITHLAKLQGWSLRETRGCIAFEVWPLCYSMVTVYLRRIDIELATDSPTLADNLITCGLATETKRGLRIAGASERIEYLLRAREAGRKGGKASGKSRASNEPSPLPSTNPSRETKPSASASASALVPDSAFAPDPVLDQEEKKNAEPPAPSPSVPKAKKKPTPKYTEDELVGIKLVLQKLTNRNQVKYEGSEAHKALIASRLRAGYSTWDLRRVIAYCADHLGWQDNPDMIAYLRPETLFGPKTMEKYVYAARAWDPAGEPPEAAQQGPPKTENVRPGANGEASEPASNVIPLRPQPGILGMFDDPAFEEPSWMTQTQTTTQK